MCDTYPDHNKVGKNKVPGASIFSYRMEKFGNIRTFQVLQHIVDPFLIEIERSGFERILGSGQIHGPGATIEIGE